MTPLLTIFLPIPGLFVAALFWPEGVHSFESMRDGILFLAVMFGVSGIAWAAFVNGVLPRGTPMRGESSNGREAERDQPT